MAIACGKCGEENAAGAKFCGRCGARLDAPAGDALLGSVIAERYRVVKAIGEGGMGRVYLAEQQLGTATRAVALKVLHATQSRDPTLRQRFYRECELVVGLTHANTIQFYDFGELPDGRLYIVMELIEGQSLARTIERGPMPLVRVERILAQIAGALGEAHARGIVHRDLKPDNILLTARGGEKDFVKVCDFGIAKRAETGGDMPQLTMQGTIIGTPQYMSPEQLTGGDADARSDIYALGLIVYEMLTGQRPFKAGSAMEWAAKHATAEPPPFESHEVTRNLPDRTKRAVMRALEKLPQARPQTAAQLADELLGKGEVTTPPGQVVITPKHTSRPVDVSAATLHASPAAIRTASPQPLTPSPALMPPSPAPSMVGPPMTPSMTPTLAPASSGLVTAAWIVMILGALLGAGGVTVFVFRDRIWPRERPPTPPVQVDAGAPIDAGSDAGPHPSVASEWLNIVLQQEGVDDAANALGLPDNTYALIRPQGVMVLETPGGARIQADGTPAPDFVINVDDVASGPYRVEVGTAKVPYRVVGTQLLGSMPIDVDQYAIPRIRYVRITNRGRRNVYVDAVGAYRIVIVNEERFRREGGGAAPD